MTGAVDDRPERTANAESEDFRNIHRGGSQVPRGWRPFEPPRGHREPIASPEEAQAWIRYLKHRLDRRKQDETTSRRAGGGSTQGDLFHAPVQRLPGLPSRRAGDL